MEYTQRPDDRQNVPPVYDETIRMKLEALTLEELKQLAEVSGTTTNSGYLMSNPDEDRREVYIDEISEISDKAQWQIDRIHKDLQI